MDSPLFEMTQRVESKEDVHVETPASDEDGPYMAKFPLAMLTLALCLCALLGSLDTVILGLCLSNNLRGFFC